MVSQKEDEQLVERVFELKCINKSVFVRLFVFLLYLLSLFSQYQTADRTRTIRQFQVKDNSRLLLVVKRFLKEMRTYNEQNVILQCL
jgi:hypothetical protein